MCDQKHDFSVSVLMTARNAESHIEAAVRSVLGQSYSDFELIVVDDRSTDDTVGVVRRLAVEDKRIVLLCAPQRGRVPCLNVGLAAATGQYVAIMDADDLAHPDRLALQTSFLEQHPEVVAVGGAVAYIGANETELPALEGRKVVIKPEKPRSVLGHWQRKPLPIMHSAAMIRREAIMEVGAYRPALIHQEDTDLFLRLEEIGEIRNLTDVLHYYRQHESNTSRRHVIAQSAAWQLALALAKRRRQGRSDWAFVHGRSGVWARLVLHAPISALQAATGTVRESVRRHSKRKRLRESLAQLRIGPATTDAGDASLIHGAAPAGKMGRPVS